MVQWNDVGVETGRFTLGEDGQIFWQANKTNPLPGHNVAIIAKGVTPLTPLVTLATNDLDQTQKDKVIDTMTTWLHAHIRDVLAPLFTMMDQDSEPKLDAAALDIGQKLYDAMGVIHRSDLESYIPLLTQDHRTVLRRKRVKLGPILVFMPELVKPAAVNMRALLYGLWHGYSLPMSRPADGRVSVTIDPTNVDRNYFRSIGYPVFGAKAIRIDMLDRVITDIYDSSKDWQFQAKHSYMEWLGCGEDDLYAILESMGFKRQKPDTMTDAPTETAEATQTAPEAVEAPSEKEPTTAETEATVTADETTIPSPSQPQSVEKQALAMFWLKKGKISERPKPKFKPNPKPEAKSFDKAKKPYKKPQKPQKQTVNTYSAKPKANEIDNDSPFAILKQLKNIK